MGLVPSNGLVLPAGATQAWLGVMFSATSPARVSCSISTHNAEKCTQWLIAKIPTPKRRAQSVSLGNPKAKAVGAGPMPASIFTTAPASWLM